jgi:TetR/AcrR family transcriptional regulator
MARGRSPDYDEQREAILARAAELFAQRGYPATTMNAVAEASGLSKPTLYHYFRDKDALLVSIAEGHVERLEALVRATEAEGLPAEARLERLIVRFVEAYADAQHAHRVLTEDVRFMKPADRARVLGKERRVVDAFAGAIAELRPDARRAALQTPLAMLLFGMINWMFTWLQPGGALTHAAMAPIVAELFRGGLRTVNVPRRTRAVAGQPL